MDVDDLVVQNKRIKIVLILWMVKRGRATEDADAIAAARGALSQ